MLTSPTGLHHHSSGRKRLPLNVASGVESSPGLKDPAKIRAFVAAAIKAFADLD